MLYILDNFIFKHKFNTQNTPINIGLEIPQI